MVVMPTSTDKAMMVGVKDDNDTAAPAAAEEEEEGS